MPKKHKQKLSRPKKNFKKFQNHHTLKQIKAHKSFIRASNGAKFGIMLI